MKRMFSFGLVLALCLTMLAGCKSTGGNYGEARRLTQAPPDLWSSQRESADWQKLTRAESAPLGDFSLEMMKYAVESAHASGVENPVLSPVSVYMAALLTACGSEGESQKGFEQLLGIPAEGWMNCGKSMMYFLNRNTDRAILKSSNSIWADDGMTLENEYATQVAGNYYADVFQMDLSSDPVVEAINEWVDQQTNGMIPGFKQDPYDDLTMFAILNAVYLDAQWQNPFKPSDTCVKNFFTQDGREISTEFLGDKLCHREYVQSNGVEGIRLPYTGEMEFLALRATDGRSAEEVLNDLTAEEIRVLSDSALPTFMNFSMPKFELEYSQALTEVLSRMGQNQTLNPMKTELSAMGRDAEGNPPQAVEISQTVKIQVDETGVKAAAVTEATDAGCAIPDEESPMELHFDRPYIYLVMDSQTGIPLFIGIMDCPEAARR